MTVLKVAYHEMCAPNRSSLAVFSKTVASESRFCTWNDENALKAFQFDILARISETFGVVGLKGPYPECRAPTPSPLAIFCKP